MYSCMALEDTVIVTERQLAGLYVREDADRYYSVLKEMGLLPLTVKRLTTETGKSLLHLATWTYLSGSADSRNHTPRISGKKDFLEYLMKVHLMGLHKRFRLSKSRNSYTLSLAENNGAVGRLIHAMGIPIRPAGYDGSAKKVLIDDELPHYFMDIVNSVPANEQERVEKRDLLYDIARILFKDRLKMEPTAKKPKQTVYLQLNGHKTEEGARRYGKSVLDFLNSVFTLHNHEGLFPENFVIIYPSQKGSLYVCKMFIRDEQLGYLATKSPPILDVSARY